MVCIWCGVYLVWYVFGVVCIWYGVYLVWCVFGVVWCGEGERPHVLYHCLPLLPTYRYTMCYDDDVCAIDT